MVITVDEQRDKLKAIKYMGLFEETIESPSTYWKKSPIDYSSLTETQKARRVDK